MRSLHEKKSCVKIPAAGVYLLVEKIAFISFIVVDVAKDFDITNRSWFHTDRHNVFATNTLKDTWYSNFELHIFPVLDSNSVAFHDSSLK